MTPVEQMTCEELEKELERHLCAYGLENFAEYVRSKAVLYELKSRRLAQSAG